MNRNYSQFLFSNIPKCYEKTSNKLQLFTEAEDKHEHCIENTTGTACIYYHLLLQFWGFITQEGFYIFDLLNKHPCN